MHLFTFTEISDPIIFDEGGEDQANNASNSLDGDEAAPVSCSVR